MWRVAWGMSAWARLRWHRHRLVLPPGAQAFQLSLQYPEQSRLQPCASMVGGMLQPGEPEGCQRGAEGTMFPFALCFPVPTQGSPQQPLAKKK